MTRRDLMTSPERLAVASAVLIGVSWWLILRVAGDTLEWSRHRRTQRAHD